MGESVLRQPRRVLVVAPRPSEADALAEGLRRFFGIEAYPVSTVGSGRLALSSGPFDAVVIDGSLGLEWLEALGSPPPVVVLGRPRRPVERIRGAVLGAWPRPIRELAAAIAGVA